MVVFQFTQDRPYSDAPTPPEQSFSYKLEEQPFTPVRSFETTKKKQKKPIFICCKTLDSGDGSSPADCELDSSPDSVLEGARLLMYLRNSMIREGKEKIRQIKQEKVCDEPAVCATDQGKGTRTQTEISSQIHKPSIVNPLLRLLHKLLSEASGEGLGVTELGTKLMDRRNQEALQGEAIPRSTKLAALMRKNPYFAELEGGKFTLWTKILAKSETPAPEPNSAQQRTQSRSESAIEKSRPISKKRRIQKNEQVLIAGDRCQRGDGKKWQCKNVAVTGKSWCEYHISKNRQKRDLEKKTRKLDFKLGLVRPWP